MLHDLGKPIRTVLRWQLLATAALILAAGAWAGAQCALSAGLGGAVSIVSGLASAIVASLGKTGSAGGIVMAALTAEAVKVGMIATLLWLVLANYDNVVVSAFIGAFLVTVLIFAMAFFVREYQDSTVRTMSAGKELNPSDYIQHHLTFFRAPVGDGDFWTLNVDTVVTSVLLGVIGLGFIWWVVRGATAGVPGKRQALVEWMIEFVDEQAKGIFHHGDRNKFVAPAALTVFVWVTLMNAMDWLPVDVVTQGLAALGFHEWRPVPTADVNATFALSISVLLLSIYFGISAHGLGGWIRAQFCAPFGKHPLLWPANFLFNMVEYVSKTLSHSLRLFGNIYAGEILFFLLWLWAATGLVGTFFGFLFGLGWAIFHILIVLLQAYIFMMLTIVYIAMAHEHH